MTARGVSAGPQDWPKDAPYAVRLKAPRQGETVVEDRVQGRVTWQNKDLDDMVLLRSDGTPTYMLAVVVDDHDMGITHIIRGDDHLTNAARQTQIYNAMGWDAPSFSHIPLIHGPDGAKLSKRHGALGVEAYRAMGYLPSAMRNYLRAARLVPRRRRDFFDRAGHRMVRPGRHWAISVALRLREARKPERALHPANSGRGACRANPENPS